jgi:hypothetical protein
MLVVRSIIRSFLKSLDAKKFLATLSAVVVVAGMLLGARVAVADSMWVQSYQRASSTEACVAQAGETPWQAAWGSDSSWSPSWEQWANKGAGGWVCTRIISWAGSAADSAGGVPSCATRPFCVLGDIGPGGGLVFLITGGTRYEMAPKTWMAGVIDGGILSYCYPGTSSIPGALGTAVGTGTTNTSAINSGGCTVNTAVAKARAYAGNDGSGGQWFLPSKDELNAICNYSRDPINPASPTTPCAGTQDASFAASVYGLATRFYWSSSEVDTTNAYSLTTGLLFSSQTKTSFWLARPIRAF